MSNFTYARLKGTYDKPWTGMTIHPSREAGIKEAAAKIVSHKDKYSLVETATGVPWYFVGILHYRESDCNFSTHLHNGDSLAKRTAHVPAGRPRLALPGEPPFQWNHSAQDALQYEGFTNQKDWSIEAIAFRFEQYNGWGYRANGCPSAYLWAGSNDYTSGKYVADHVFDASVVDVQQGTMPILKEIMTTQNITIPLSPDIATVAQITPAAAPATVSAPAAPTLSPKADVPPPTNDQMNKTSRKYWWHSCVQWSTGIGGGLGATIKGLDASPFEEAHHFTDVIKGFFMDYGWWCGGALVLGVIAFCALQKSYMTQDVVEGRATPSGSAAAAGPA